jgi:esterase/lipase superfamily enzyme
MIVGVGGLTTSSMPNTIMNHVVAALNKNKLESKKFKHTEFLIYHTYDKERVIEAELALHKILDDGDSILAHSFGAVLTIDLLNHMENGFLPKKKLKNIYLFNPAIDKDAHIPTRQIKNMYVFYEPCDRMLKLATLMPFNKLGELGRVGYKGRSKKIHNMQIRKLGDSWTNHSDAFREPNLNMYVKMISKLEKEQTKIIRARG